MSTARAARARTVAALYDESRLSANRAVLFHAALAGRAGINVTDVNCLAILDKEGPKTPGELAQWMGLSRGGAITSVIDRMEKAGFVRRGRDPQDRRRVLVELVREGAYEKLQGTFDELHRSYTALIEGYTEQQRELLLDFAERANEIVLAQTRKLQDR
ncbi:MarR family transcriptional regulator [Amycolatopsis nigrescens]|uniref:MarR family transcriptional regulator n=1 Tax=Amycolatopsis nigrescens TaxID=381445 RepID=UPI000476E78F|nr:MarR family transcriptional regulator [Amycolatopsis nigrescens]